jgi:hypothetical protein
VDIKDRVRGRKSRETFDRLLLLYSTASWTAPGVRANDMQRWAMITTTARQKQKIGQDKSPDWSRADPRLVLFWINSASPAPSARRIPLQILSYLGNRPLASEGASKPRAFCHSNTS